MHVERPGSDAAGAIREYAAPGIVVTWESDRCRHAAECVHGLPGVFDTSARPWIDPNGATVDELVEVIDRCPSYALGYRRTTGGPAPRRRANDGRFSVPVRPAVGRQHCLRPPQFPTLRVMGGAPWLG